MILRCATTNAGKLREFHLAAERLGFPQIDIQPLDGLKQIEPCEEDGATFEENAVKKAVYYSRYTADPIFADDSGLEVDALGGEPGVYSARYSPEGTDSENNRLVLERMEGRADRTARFVCVIALAHEGRLAATFRGTVEGRIAQGESGPHGFGYDPLFYYPPFGCTFGEVERERKMRVSHRGEALRQLLDYFFLNFHIE
ncbi:MAG: RdgB/HAM1 family non-canonical purine NTP pyrophosphatase [Acidobacteria bacterium]|nr:RdgB/HAM1 family non-canonical purine NTP pyrophosphatase [Acidobacteriota bacterium]